MAESILLDTNALLDYANPHRKEHESVFELVEYAFRHGVKIATCSSSLKDFYYVTILEEKRQVRAVQKSLEETDATAINEMAFALLEAMTENFTVIATGHNDARMACSLKSMHNDFEDNLVISAAMRLKPVCLVTSDEELIEHSPVLAVHAAKALEILKLSA